ncbi:GTP-binding protein [Marinicella meishanensis]|uniref:GTP-binding protein n=1 Tax=Marinicella meishanensis TaxID=2873263 RepID=UPI001CBB5FFE|nr:hypothetical protein [Marinicella sp. NBU2979]
MHKKVAFIGSVGSGKTTIIDNLSSINTVNTDVESSVDIGKEMTTVGIDYGHIVVDQETTLGLYGVPGQRKFSFIWDFVKDGLWAVVILVRNRDRESIHELDHLLDYFDIQQHMPCVIGITHVDSESGESTIKKIKSTLQPRGLNLPVYTIDARDKECANLIMRTLIAIEESQ